MPTKSNYTVIYLSVSITKSKQDKSVTVSIFAPFWLINKSGQQIAWHTSDLTIRQRPTTDFPLLFAFKPGHFSKKKLSLSIGTSTNSDSFSIDAVGNMGNVICKEKNGNGDKLVYAASIDISLSSFQLTKIVTVKPFYSIVNRTALDVEISEDLNTWIPLLAHSQKSLWPQSDVCNLYFKAGGHLTPPIRFKDPNQSLLAIGSYLVNVLIDVNVYEVKIQMNDYYPGAAPLRIFNTTDEDVIYSQLGTRKGQKLMPRESTYFLWPEPTGRRELSWRTTTSDEHTIEPTHDAAGNVNEGRLYWVVFLDGKQRTLVITADTAVTNQALQASEFTRPRITFDMCMKGFGLSLVNDELRKELIYMAITASEVAWELRKNKSKRYKPISVKSSELLEQTYQRELLRRKVDTIASGAKILSLSNGLKVDVQDLDRIVLLEPQRGTLRRSAAPGLSVSVQLGEHTVQFHVKINRLQIDNQMHECLFPIIMCPVTPPKSLAQDRAPKSFIEFSAVLQRMSNLNRFKYMSVLIQEFLIQIDGQFIMGMLEFTGRSMEAKPLDYTKLIMNDLELVTEEENFAEASELVLQKNFYDLIHFSPIKVHVSFSLGGVSSWEMLGMFDLLIKSAGVTLTEFKDVLFRIDFFERKNSLMANDELISEATSHYVRQVLKQFYVIVLGLDVIGNPVGLVMGLGQGFGDLFYEPFLGVIEGPEEFAEGLALGVKSLFSHTLGGAAGALSKITGTLGEGKFVLGQEYCFNFFFK